MPAMISTADELLAALDPLPHADRLRHTAITARRLAARDALRPLLTALDARGPYERRLAALAALTAGDLGHLEARLADPDPVVRRYALRGARRLPVRDTALEAAYDDAPAVVRADLARLLRDGRRPALAERLVPRVRTEYGDRDAARLLPGCSTAFTARLLPELAGALAFEDWSTLALRHPVAVLDHAERELRDLPERFRDRWWQQHGTGIAAALPAAPGRVLDLLEQWGPYTLPGPVHERLGDLVAVDAERVARRLADSPSQLRWERTPGPAVMRRLVAADPPSLPRLGSRWLRRNAFEVLLRAMPPARRPGFLDEVAAIAGDARSRSLTPPDGVLALLPAADRHARARAAIAELRADRATFWDLWGTCACCRPPKPGPSCWPPSVPVIPKCAGRSGRVWRSAPGGPVTPVRSPRSSRWPPAGWPTSATRYGGRPWPRSPTCRSRSSSPPSRPSRAPGPPGRGPGRTAWNGCAWTP